MMDTIKILDHKNTVIVAHRGLSGLERENTCAAFVAAGLGSVAFAAAGLGSVAAAGSQAQQKGKTQNQSKKFFHKLI